MVNFQSPVIDRTFAALADPTRRALLARLDAQSGVSISDLARPFPVSLPAIMKHLDVLSDAGLIARKDYGTVPPKVEYKLTPKGKSFVPVIDSIRRWGHRHLVAG